MRNALKLTTPTDREIVVVREFDAPRELVWDSIFKPELLRRWFYTNVELVLPVRGKHTRCECRPMSSHLVERTVPSALEGIHWLG
jgi:uncharacterized protein YndB with AHSA1/START domain